MRSLLTPLVLLAAIAGLAFAGDVATFENLGFNDRGRVFVFGQYGLGAEDAAPYAEIYAVDVPGNRFLPNGVFAFESDAPLSLGQDGRGALYTLLSDARNLLSREGINHLNGGRPIYILADRSSSPERLSFRDFNSQARYDVVLSQQQRGSGESVSAAFSIELKRTVGDRIRTYTIGRPGFYREGVASYRITQIIAAPDDASLVIVVERRALDGSTRYMVETTGL